MKKKFVFALVALLCISMLSTVVVGAADATATSTPTPSPSPTAIYFAPTDIMVGNTDAEWANCDVRIVDSGEYSTVVDCREGIGTMYGVVGYTRNGVEYSLSSATTLFLSGGPVIVKESLSCMIKLATGSSGQIYVSFLCGGMYEAQMETDWVYLGEARFGITPTATPAPSATPTASS